MDDAAFTYNDRKSTCQSEKKITVYTAKSFDCECPEKNDEEWFYREWMKDVSDLQKTVVNV